MKADLNLNGNVLDVIRNRRSIRSFSDKSIDKEQINAMFEAARWSPSAMNEQPWLYIYATRENKALHTAIAESLMPGNKKWAEKAPLLIVSMARPHFLSNGKHNSSALHDTGMANLAVSLQATAMGLHTHMMGGFDPVVLKKNLNLPGDLHVAVVIAVGYAGDPELLPEELKRREKTQRSRMEHEQFTFSSNFS
ncbi:MAG TPA: nitroreductase family protein [Agriterribacter sp.]|nr:nitroreductase family protein [Agriterribacter sp.]